MTSDQREFKVNLYLEQIKYLVAENNTIQEKFLSGVNLPIAALGILLFYIESSTELAVKSMYLLLPFLYLFIPYNLIKFSTRMLSINGYLKHLEKEINLLMGERVFMWNSNLINCSSFPSGFAMVTTIGQMPIHIVLAVFLVIRFVETLEQDHFFEDYHMFFSFFLVVELIAMVLMFIDTGNIQKTVLKKIDDIMKKDKIGDSISDKQIVRSAIMHESMLSKIYRKILMLLNDKVLLKCYDLKQLYNQNNEKCNKYTFTYKHLWDEIGKDRDKLLELKAETKSSDYMTLVSSLISILAFLVAGFSLIYEIGGDKSTGVAMLIFCVLLSTVVLCVIKLFKPLQIWRKYILIALDEIDVKKFKNKSIGIINSNYNRIRKRR